MSIAIKAENLSKAYQLGEIGTGTISRDLERWYARMRGKEDPFLRIGETNDRTAKGNSDVVWSLKDINFEIEQGDAVGIIGRNGAGKSTLLKVLSRVTSPTTGRITGKGRIASLLEVGTGFHPELTGRENIYLNGAILGMRKKEITRKFDEIVDFAGVERYIDTPVKRYSSGMYVRLAFAVAAHLESEILIVDEVLAVGDAEFQKKCLGKMGEVSKGEGRTVLFVSHNMEAVLSLTDHSILLENGKLIADDKTSNVVNTYKGKNFNKNKTFQNKTFFNKKIYCNSAEIISQDKDYLTLIIAYTVNSECRCLIAIECFSQNEISVFTIKDIDDGIEKYIKPNGKYNCIAKIPIHHLMSGIYSLNISFAEEGVERFHLIKEALTFEIINIPSEQHYNSRSGIIKVTALWD
ncbi:ABC transporter ATP-binding protein [Pedobacter helvus]|uniref:Polysaccharide ABC transporter ATP-binding protein n=1 Tax=Pedobacter helvus TaxID=2563444 RepID=A0ABW9JNA3_9SPHI|nr:ABC transporter ATP-binding protein [Pedobacter ureilyticus]